MIKLLPQEYLRSGKTLQDLKDEHGVDFTITNGKISLSYNQIEASTSDPLASQCRGLILRENTYDVVAVPFFRFLNHGEGNAAQIDWNTAKAYSKLDGSLLIVHFDSVQKRWHVATRKRSEADGYVNDNSMMFHELFDLAVRYKTKEKHKNVNEFMTLFGYNAHEYTFCFELVSPFNQVVVRYDEPDLFLLGVRHMQTLQEIPITNWKHVSDQLDGLFPITYDFNNITDLIEMTDKFSPSENEGIVVCDDKFNRIKIKSAAYVAYNKLHDSLSNSHRNCLEIVLLGKDDDVVPMVPRLIGERITRIKNAYVIFIKHLREYYNKIKDIENQKEFAIATSDAMYAPPLFALRNGKINSLEEFFTNDIKPSKLDSVLNKLQEIDAEVMK